MKFDFDVDIDMANREEFLKLVNHTPARAVHDIRSAKVSPWVLYLSETGGDLLTRFNDEQVKMIQHVIDTSFWMKQFGYNKEEVEEIKKTCEVAGI